MVKRTNDKHRAAWNTSREMADLLGWARHPSPEPLSLGWADAYKKNTVSTVDYALQVFESDESVCKKLKSARKLAFEFIALLAGNPTLAAIPVHDWNVQAYRQLFDDLSALEREFKILSHTAEAPATMEPTAAAVPVAPGAEFVDSDYAEPIFKSDLAILFNVQQKTIARRIQSGALRTLPGTSNTAKKVRVHGDDFPAGLKRPNERKQKLSTMPKRGN